VDSNLVGVASGWLPRLRRAYGTFGGLEAGQDTGILHDPDADPELVDQGGEATGAGRAREPQIRYTYQGPYGTVWTIGGENPVPRLNGPFGQVDYDTGQIPNIAACNVTANNTAATPSDTACLGNLAFFSPLKSEMPEWIATARINQPWGHVQLGGVIRTDNLVDGQYLNQRFFGGGGTLSGDVHPFAGAPGPLGRDDLGFGAAGGPDINGQIANGSGIVTNFGAPIFVTGLGTVNPLSGVNAGAQTLTTAWNAHSATQSLPATAIVNGINVRQAYDRLVRSQESSSVGGWIWYQHWWTDNLRSTIEASGIYNAMNTNILPQGTTNNKLLAMAHANLYWSPVAFVDFGAEFAWGHRVTVANFKGDSNTILGSMRVRF
jgi:DcaP outer membrane protein